MNDVIFVQLPFSLISQPGLAVSIFAAELRQANISCKIHYANMIYAKKVGFKHYESMLNTSTLAMFGEMIFAKTAGFTVHNSYNDYFDTAFHHKNVNSFSDTNNFIEIFLELERHAQDFIQQTAQFLVAEKPAIVACSSNFQQNNACFSLFKAIKEIDSSIVTLMGGSNCTADAAVTIATEIPWVDYVFSGEGDGVFASISRLLMEYGASAEQEMLPTGLINKKWSPEKPAPYKVFNDMDASVIPDYSDYFKALKENALEEIVVPALLIEGSRGCWWGEKNPCTFCGLGNVHNTHRSKSTQRLFDEMTTQSKQWGLSRFTFTDCILSLHHERELPDMLIKNACDYAIFSEIKSNTDENRIRKLREAGFTCLQPGIEGLQDEYLTLMNKGNSGIKHIELLKLSKMYGINLSWNLLLGFPGEKEIWLEELLEIIPLLRHLPPPMAINHIVYQKHSVYTKNPKNYDLELRPVPTYTFAYNGNTKLAEGLAYNFEPVSEQEQSIYYDIRQKSPRYKAVVNAVSEWKQAHRDHRGLFCMIETGEKLEITDYRGLSPNLFHTLIGVEKAVYQASRAPIKIEKLCENLGNVYSADEVTQAVTELTRKKLSITMKGQTLALATEKTGFGYAPFSMFPYGQVKVDKENSDE